jgi:ketosteroid isomerase-like protein
MLADAKFEIEQVLVRYCHAVDRCDLKALKSVFWPDAIADYGMGSANAHAFAEGLIPSLLSMLLTQHFVSNLMVQFNDDVTVAQVQSYCAAFHLVGEEGAWTEMEVGGRYLDRMEKRDGEWRIADRQYVMDWNRNGPATALWDQGLYAQLSRRGARAPDDPYYGFVAKD